MPAYFFICQYFYLPIAILFKRFGLARLKRPSDIKIRPEGRTFNYLLLSLFGKAIAAIYRAIVPGLERNLTGLSAGRTDCIVHFTLLSAAVFPSCPAGRTSFGFIGESLFFIKVLFACGECEFLTAVCAYERFILMSHINYLFKNISILNVY